MARRVIAVLCLAGCLAGCQQNSETGFQSFEEKRQGGYVPPESFPAENSANDNEPLLAEVAPEPGDDDPNIWDQPVSALAPVNVVDGSNIADIIRVAKATATPVSNGAAPDQVANGPRKVELLIKDKEFRPEGPGGALRVAYDDLDLLKILNMEPVTADADTYFPKWLTNLDGQRIRIRGYMMPTFESTGLERFVMARDTGLCCFGRNPKVYDLISVELKSDKPTDYIHLRPFDVVGTLKVELVAEDNRPIGLYWIEDAEVVRN